MRLLARLPAFLRRPLRIEEARRVLRERFERRATDFLALVRAGVYRRPASPFCRLLDAAGCQYGDLERLVAHDGVDGALQVLYRHGVYLSVDEFKGRRPVVRGALTLSVGPRSFWNPAVTPHVLAGTSGGRGASAAVPIDLATLRDRAVNSFLGLDARDGAAWLKAHWQVPGAGALARLLEFAAFGAPPVRWFSHVDLADPQLHARYRWSARLLRWGSLAAGVLLPHPEHVPLAAPLPIARWMAAALRAGRVPHLFTFVSSAVRLCEAAAAAGIDLAGAQLTVTGEPLTRARLAVVRRSGATAVPRYAVMECGAIGLGCLRPAAPDDVHLLHDLHAVVRPDRPGREPAPLFVTSLSPTAPYLLLNVSTGDEAVVESRACGCRLEALGWPTHLRAIRSREKLTAGGVTFSDDDVIRVLEEVLPGRFGGGPTDYQLIEAEGPGGQPRLALVVHPAVASVDPDCVARVFLEALAEGDGARRVAGLLWRDADFLRVERRAPDTLLSGKILHLHSAHAVAGSVPPGR